MRPTHQDLEMSTSYLKVHGWIWPRILFLKNFVPNNKTLGKPRESCVGGRRRIRGTRGRGHGDTMHENKAHRIN